MIDNNTRIFTFTDEIPLNVTPMIRIGSLVMLVNTARIGSAIAYWTEDLRNDKRGDLYESNYPYTYSFEIRADRNTGWYTVDVNTIKLGIERVINGSIKLNPKYVYGIKEALKQESDDGIPFDAEELDIVIQAGLFNEIVYG